MPKNWYMKFEFRIWRTDTALRRCSLETRAFWLECLCIMHEMDEYEVSGTYDELSRLIGCDADAVGRCAIELQRTKTADVTLGNGIVTLLSRRMKRELKGKKQNALRVQKHRSNADVTPVKRDIVRVIVNSNSKEEEEEVVKTPIPTSTEHELSNFEYPVKDLILAFPNERFNPSQLGFIENAVLDTPVDREAWADTITLYVQNYDPATRSYVPTRTGTLLDIFKKKKKELTKNGTNKGYGKRTDQDVFAESADFYANYQG